MKGLLLALQFFTIVPIRKELPLNRRNITAMFIVNPWVGASIGLLMFATSELFLNIFQVGTFLTAVFIVLIGIVCTGGLHLDGFADTSDALFSYRDQTKRHEILADPRIGAFGTMAIVLIILVKVALIQELLSKEILTPLLFIAIPLVARAAMNIYLTITKLAKPDGLAAFFKQQLAQKWTFFISLLWILVMLFILGVFGTGYLPPLLIGVTIFFLIILFQNGSRKHFGGVTGDLLGAFIVGTEAMLWLVVLLSS